VQLVLQEILALRRGFKPKSNFAKIRKFKKLLRPIFKGK